MVRSKLEEIVAFLTEEVHSLGEEFEGNVNVVNFEISVTNLRGEEIVKFKYSRGKYFKWTRLNDWVEIGLYIELPSGIPEGFNYNLDVDFGY